jgi:hypothetical protein
LKANIVALESATYLDAAATVVVAAFQKQHLTPWGSKIIALWMCVGEKERILSA